MPGVGTTPRSATARADLGHGRRPVPPVPPGMDGRRPARRPHPRARRAGPQPVEQAPAARGRASSRRLNATPSRPARRLRYQATPGIPAPLVAEPPPAGAPGAPRCGDALTSPRQHGSGGACPTADDPSRPRERPASKKSQPASAGQARDAQDAPADGASGVPRRRAHTTHSPRETVDPRTSVPRSITPEPVAKDMRERSQPEGRLS